MWFAKKIRQFMKSKKLVTKAQFYEFLRKNDYMASQTTVGNWINGKAVPDNENLLVLADIFEREVLPYLYHDPANEGDDSVA